MYSRPLPSRNQRSKGIRVKHILQICLLLAVSFWLIYQVKHSHDKKKEFDETDAKTALNNNNDLLRLGRKDLPQGEEKNSKSDNHDEDTEEEEITAEEEENKKIAEEEEDEVVDEHETEKPNEEDETEIKEKDSEDSFTQTGKEKTDGEDKEESHDARDENYKADDASSAVTHDIQTVTTENSTVHHAHITGKEIEVNSSEEDSKIEVPNGVEVENSEVAKENNQSNVTTNQIEEKTLDETANSFSLNSTQGLETGNNDAKHNEDIPANDESIEGFNSTGPVEIKDAQLISDELSSNSTDSTLRETELRAEESETVDAEKSDITDEVLASEMDENHEDVQIESIDLSDPSDSLEMKHVRNDLETLPDIQTQGTDSED